MAKKKSSKSKTSQAETGRKRSAATDAEGSADAVDEPVADFESALSEVKSIVEKLESGSLDLTSSLENYEIGIKRLKQCHQLLDEAEQKVAILSGFDSEGNPITEPMPETHFRSAGSSVEGPATGGQQVDDNETSASLF